MILHDKNKLITNGIARNNRLFGVILIDERDRHNNPDSSLFVVWCNEKWHASKNIPFRVVSLCTLGMPVDRFVLLGENGEISVLGSGQDAEEKIERSIQLPLTCIENIKGKLYAVGMGRQVYLRESENHWVAIHESMLSKNTNELVGFQTIIQCNNEIYAAGWGGEIWRLNNGWEIEDSPTNYILSDSTVSDDNKVVFCGRQGTIVTGNSGAWQVADHQFSDDLWSIINYNNVIYTSSNFQIYSFNNLKLEPIEISLMNYKGTHYKLQGINNHLFSFGELDILINDGVDWSRIPTE